ncbi:hypothetical protein [Luteibacter sp. CQ10]|uniref:hypothetical protein n=1 Tax=Luteibacter sp. CQ10 TaxID=2805821 RepID=UPI0034A310A4
MRFIFCKSLLSVALLLGCGAAAAAAPPATGLGQSWPNAPDLSGNSHFHVYAFTRSGVRYVQVNDLNGNVRGAIGYVDGQVLELPIGMDADRWTVTTDPSAPAAGDPVYQDDGMTIRAAPQADGTMRLLAAPTQCDGSPPDCAMK